MTTKRSRRKHKEAEQTSSPDTPSSTANGSAPEEPSAPGVVGADNAPQDALNDRLLRLQADFDNYRKRVLREREAERLRCNEDLIVELLPILDHLEMGIRTAESQGIQPQVIQGFSLVLDQALGALRKFGLEPIDAEGIPFDPHTHESVAMAPSDTVARDNVLAQVRRGYRLGSQLLRPAQVVLSLGPAETDPAEQKKECEPAAEPGGDPLSDAAGSAE